MTTGTDLALPIEREPVLGRIVTLILAWLAPYEAPRRMDYGTEDYDWGID